MLSEAEQRRLTAIEAQLRADDPVFAQQFGEGGQHIERSRWRCPSALLTVVVAAVGAMTGLVLQNVGLVIVALIAMTAGVGMLITDYRHP